MSQEDMVIEEIDIEQAAINLINEFNDFYNFYSNEGNVKEGADEEVNNNLDNYEQEYVNIISYINEKSALIDSKITGEFPEPPQVSKIALLRQIEQSLEDQQILDRILLLRKVYPFIPVSNTNNSVPMNPYDSFPGPVSGPVYEPDTQIHHIFLFIAHGEDLHSKCKIIHDLDELLSLL